MVTIVISERLERHSKAKCTRSAATNQRGRPKGTGVDLSKILGGQTKILGGQKVVKSDKCMGVFQLFGGTCPGCPPKVYTYAKGQSMVS